MATAVLALKMGTGSMRWIGAGIAVGVMLMAGVAQGGPVGKAKDAVDPDCTPAKAAKGATQHAAVGVGNRCDVGETARDVTGTDDRQKDGPLNRDGKDSEKDGILNRK